MKKLLTFTFYGVIVFNMCMCKPKKDNTPVVIVIPDKPKVEEPVVDPFKSTACGENQTMDDLTKLGWTNIWKDEFDTDLNNWKKWIGGAFNGEYQYYTGEKNITLYEGLMKITPKMEPVRGVENPFSATEKNFNYTSARIESGMKFKPNGPNYTSLRFAARIRTATGIGMWPAFWLYGDDWPTNGEIDILEQNGAKPKEYSSTYHYGRTINADEWIPADLGLYKSDIDLTLCWHIYECIWDRDKISYLIDGKEYFANTGRNVPLLYDKYQNIAINLAVGGNYVGNPAINSLQLNPMYVDWVRVFSK